MRAIIMHATIGMHAINSAPAWIEAIGALLTGVATLLAAVAALRGLNAWGRETVERRKAELAEEVLALFYRARDILTWARFPAGQARGEVGALTPGPDESAQDASEKQRMYAPVERLAQENRIFSELQASRYRFMAYFGEEASKPFEEIRALQTEVVAAASKLIRAGKPESADSGVSRGEWESTIGWGAAEEDKIAHRLERAVRDIERVCRPLIDARATAPWPPRLFHIGLGAGARFRPRDSEPSKEQARRGRS